MQARHLTPSDQPALEALLLSQPNHNLFHLSALRESGLALPGSSEKHAWATGIYRGGELAGGLVAFRGTGGIYHTPGDNEVLAALSNALLEMAARGVFTLLSGHETQINPILPLTADALLGPPDRCRFCLLLPGDLTSSMPAAGFSEPRMATAHDMERLIDFYMTGFYSLAHLPTREAWRDRLSEQLRHRTLFVIEDKIGRVASAALASAEGGNAAMLGGVATLTAYRGRGLSTLCVGALCRGLFERGTRSIALFYLLDNAPAAQLYNKLGFRPAGEWLLVPVGRPFRGKA